MASDPQFIAACLDLDENIIRQLQARGHLLDFDLTEVEVRQRLYDAHLAYSVHDRQNLPPLAFLDRLSILSHS